MRSVSWRILVCFTVCLLAASTVLAQEQGQGRGGRGGRGGGGFGGRGGFRMSPAMFAFNEQVQKELKVSDEQKEKLKSLQEEFGPGGGRGFGGPGGGGQGQRPSEEERAKMREEMQKRVAEQTKKVEEVLTPDQNKRLKQISLWTQGGAALGNEDVAKELNLSDEQKTQVKTISDEVNNRRGELFREAQGDFAGMQEKMKQLRKDSDEEFLAVLTDEQKSKFEALLGPKFELDMSQMLRGGPGGGGPGGGRRRDRGNNN